MATALAATEPRAVPEQIPALPRVTTQVVRLNPELWPDLEEQLAALEAEGAEAVL